MFKAEIEFITDLTVSKLNVDKKVITLHKIARSKIHPAIIKYIIASVDEQIFADIHNLSKNSNFDYTGNKVSKYLRLISAEIKLNKKFSFEEITMLINEAVSFNINYLTRPNKTLANFVFESTRRKNINEITQKLQFAYYYRFLPKILLTHLTKKRIKAISKIEFNILLRKIDTLAKKKHLQGTINTAINSMVNFFDCTSITAEKVPVLAVDLFLKEKGLKSYYNKLDKEFSTNDSKILLGLVIKDTLSNIDEQKASNKKRTKLTSEETVNLTNEEKIVGGTLVASLAKVVIANNIFNKDNLSVDAKKIVEPNNKVEIDNSTLVATKEKIEPIENINVVDSSLKKPEAKAAIKKIVDINDFYNSFDNNTKPSENKSLISSISKFLDNFGLSKLTGYKIDPSHLDSEFNIPEDSEKDIEDEEFQSIYDNDEEIELKNLVPSDDTQKSIVEQEQFELTDDRKNMVDEYISDVKDEKSIKDISKNIIDNEIIEENDTKTIEDNEITLTEEISEEVTEVFSDITYLEKENIEDAFEEEDSKKDIEEKIDSEDINDFDITDLETIDENKNTFNNEEVITEVSTETKIVVSQLTFTETTTNNDMSTIIETIFDYDMEDYQDMVSSISNSKSEPEAIQLVNNYCLKNGVSLSMSDVTSFKSIISTYYSQQQV